MSDVTTVSVVERSPGDLGYDYIQLEEATRKTVLTERDNIHRLYKESQENILNIGHALINVKEILPRGQFTRWLEAEFGWSVSSAGRFMQVAKQFPEISHVERFEPSALYALAANSTPDDVRDSFVLQAESGKPVLLQDVREALGSTRPRKNKPIAIELVSEIVRLIDKIYIHREDRTKVGQSKTNLISQEIESYTEEEQPTIALALDRFGSLCMEAAKPYLSGENR